MILTVAGLGVAAVMVMGMMAQRVSSIVADKTGQEQKRASHAAFRTGGSAFRTGDGAHDGEAPAVTDFTEAITESQESPGDRAIRYVDAFLEVRQAMRAALDETSGVSTARRTEIARTTRDAALARSWMEPYEYRQLLMIYRSWKAGRSAPTREFGQAFDRRRERAAASDLGPVESMDL